MRPTPAAPARSSRCFLRTASFPARSPESGETPSPVPPSRGGRLRFKKSDRAMSSPLCLRVLGVLGDKVGRSDLARGEPALGNRHGQRTGGGAHGFRTEERLVGTEGVRTWISRWSAESVKKNNNQNDNI